MRTLHTLWWSLLCVSTALAACGADPRVKPSVLMKVAGDKQFGNAKQVVPIAPTVVCLDDRGEPMPGIVVHFSVVAGDGSVVKGSGPNGVASITTNSEGRASCDWRLGSVTSTQYMKASVEGVERSAVFSALAGVRRASIKAESGNDQDAKVATALPQNPVVLVQDQFGMPFAGETVNWALEGPVRGAVSAAQGITGDDGRASTGWALGTKAGENRLRASVRTAGVEFRATGFAGAPTSIVKTSADTQAAAPGSTVPVAPTIRVTDEFGNGVQGVDVEFRVTGGGGSVASGSTTTNYWGQASAIAWTLGTALGDYTLGATAAGLPPVLFTAMAVPMSPHVAVIIESPTTGQRVADEVMVTARVNSLYQLESVRAAVGSVEIPLQFRYSNLWSGSLSLAGSASGPLTIRVTATDVFGNATASVAGVVLDRKPTLTVSEPMGRALARPSLTIAATCSDEDPAGCRSLSLAVSGAGVATKTLLTGTSQLTEVLNLAEYAGRAITLTFTAVDSGMQSASVTREIFVDTNSALKTVSEQGVALDISAGRVLFVRGGASQPALSVRDDAAGTITDVERNAGFEWSRFGDGHLFDGGVIYLVRSAASASDCTLREWRDGVVAELGVIRCDTLQRAGSFAAYTTQYQTTMTRRDLAAGTNLVVPRGVLSSTGDVYYSYQPDPWSLQYDLMWHHDGASSLIVGGCPGWQVVDGTNVLFLQDVCAPFEGEPVDLFLFDGRSLTLLGRPLFTNLPDTRESFATYAVSGDWIAYAKPDSFRASQVWRRGEGAEEQVTFYSTSSRVEAVNGQGSIVLTNGSRRYLARRGLGLQLIGSSDGEVLVREERFFLIIVGHALEIVP